MIDLKVYENMDQGTPEWLEARRGILTASTIGQLITTHTIKVADNDKSRSFIRNLTVERITGHIEPVYVTRDMERGTLDEPYARDAYAEHTGFTVNEIGFMVRTFSPGIRIGYSPDGLVGSNGLIEIKSRRQRVQFETILDDAVPANNMAQIQCGLLVSGRDWCDYISYSSGMPLYIKRVFPDPRWQDALVAAATAFEYEAGVLTADYNATVASNGYPDTERINHFVEEDIF